MKPIPSRSPFLKEGFIAPPWANYLDALHWATGVEILTAVATLNYISIPAAGTITGTVTVSGAAVGDGVALGLPASPAAGIVFQGYVSAADTVTIAAMNITGSAVDPASASYRVFVFKALN